MSFSQFWHFADHRVSMIKVESVSKRFGGVQAVNNTSIEIAKGSITGLIGPTEQVKPHYLTWLLVI